MYHDTADWDGDDGFEIYTGMALEMFLKVDPKSTTFIRYIHQIVKLIRRVYPDYRPINFDRDMTEYKTFLSELKGFLKDVKCPYKEFTSACMEMAIENKRCRRRLLKYLNYECTSAIKIDKFFKKHNNKNPLERSKDTPGTSSCTNYNQDNSDDEDSVPNKARNMRPGEVQYSQRSQVVDEAAKKGATLENKLGELTIDTQQPSQSVIPTLQQNYATPVHCSTGGAQYGNSANNFQHFFQTGRYHNIRYNQNVLPNQQQGYLPQAFNHNFNFTFPRPQNSLSSQAVRPIQTDWINPLNQNRQGIWNSHIHRNEGLLQGANQNRGLNDNIRYNLNHQWHRNVPSPYIHNQNLNIAQQQALNFRPEYWSTRGSGNIPITQSNQHGWNTQGPRNTGLSLFGNSYNDQQAGRVQGGEYQNQMIYGNMQYHLNNQQNYRPPTFQIMNIPRPQQTYVSHGDGATYYITNISIYHGQEGGNGQSGITGIGAYQQYSGINNTIQGRGNMPHREYQNPSCNGQNTNSYSPRY